MSISSEISRISGNISDSLSAVATKGVTVPSGSNSDDLAGLIAQIPGGGTSFSKLSSFQIQNGRTGTVTVVRLVYNETTMIGAYNSNVTKSSTATYTDMLTDGSHVWFRLSQGTTLKYNGNNADYVRDGQYFKVTLPSGYDGTIPFVFT